ncbi:hypothetical protein HDU99_008892, partial [Rhizoclosmatium hyalinum]
LVLTFEPFTAVQRWRIAIAWVKAAQGCDDISIEAGIPDDFDVAMARRMIKYLVSVINIMTMSSEDFALLVYPYVSILDEYLVSILEVYFKVSSLETKNWGQVFFQESVILQTSEDRLLLWNSIKANLMCIEPEKVKLLFRASQYGFSNTEFHRVCDGTEYTLTLVQSENGHVFGGCCDSAWEYGITKPATEVFLFKVNKNDVLTFHPRLYLKKAIRGEYGPTFGAGNDLRIDGKTAFCAPKSYDFSDCTPDRFLGTDTRNVTGTGKSSSCNIIEYEVFKFM